MVQSVVWSKPAVKDLERIFEYIFEDDPGYAYVFYQNVIEKAKTLSGFPKRGRTVPELENNAIREIFIHRYRMIYRIEAERILVLTFIHGARQLDSSRIDLQ